MRGLSSTRASLAALVLTGASLTGVTTLVTLTGAAASAATPTCDGKKATIVATGHRSTEVNGTGGDDVIVATDAGRTYGHGGNDTICLRGDNAKGLHWAFGDGGDDRIFVDSPEIFTVAVLGSGDDYFEGGSGEDTVYAAEMTPDTLEHNIVHTGGGADRVNVRGGHGASDDDIRLGSGADVLEVNTAGVLRTVRGGPGGDGITFPSGLAVTIDNRTGRADTNNGLLVRWTSMEGFSAGANLTFFGSDKAEHVSTFGGGTLQAQLGGGDDVALSESCFADVRGDQGDDLLKVTTPYLEPCSHAASFKGGPGDDRLVGGSGDDVLDGGSGTDYADGRAGSDTCLAETVTGCEA